MVVNKAIIKQILFEYFTGMPFNGRVQQHRGVSSHLSAIYKVNWHKNLTPVGSQAVALIYNLIFNRKSNRALE